MHVADIIYYNSRIITVNAKFTIAEALAIKGDRFYAVGKNEDILSLAGSNTKIIDLKNKTVIPGLNDSHLHPTMAAVSELKEQIPDIRTTAQLIEWIKKEVKLKEPGQWIVHPKLFITRTKERRYPSLSELDNIAPGNPVFLNGSYSGMVNTYALEVSGLLKGKLKSGILKDPESEKLSGIIRPDIFPFLAYKRDTLADEDMRLSSLSAMLKRYNKVGITSVTDGWVTPSDMTLYKKLKDIGQLGTRVSYCLTPEFKGSNKSPAEVIGGLGSLPGEGDEFLRTGAVKIFLDGGILTATASIKKPWGEKCMRIFGFDGSDYYGHLNYTQEEVTEIALEAVKKGWKFTAHCIGDRALDILLTAFEQADRVRRISDLRWSVIHGNFFDSNAIKRAADLGVIIEFQIAWLYKDASYIRYILGQEYEKKFLPLKSMINGGVKLSGGSDHMVKFDSLSSINPYNPFLSIQTMITRRVEDGRIVSEEESISRKEALRLYTIAGAYSTGEENIKGSIEPGRLADMVILDTDYLNCDENIIKDTKVLKTILGGKVVYEKQN